jgi:hypothetical protein
MTMVSKLDDYRAADTVRTLETLLTHAKAGRIVGFIGAWTYDTGAFRHNCTGLYGRNHIAALGAAGKLFAKINEADKS